MPMSRAGIGRTSTGRTGRRRTRHAREYFPRVEEIDRAIVAALTADGRLSYTDLAEKVGLSVSAVHQRVRRLEQRGVLKGYVARVDFEAVGLPLTAFVAIRPIDAAAPDDAPVRLAGLPEIESCYSVAGGGFLLLPGPGERPGGPARPPPGSPTA